MDPDPAPAGGGTPPAAPPFDVNAFMTQFLGKVEQVIDTKLAALKPAPPPDPPEPPPPAPEPPKDAPATVDRSVVTVLQRQLSDVHKQLKDEVKEREQIAKRSEEKDRISTIRSMTSNYVYADDNAKENFLTIMSLQIKRAQDGETLVGPDGVTPAKEYIDAQLALNNYYLAGVERSGSGAHNQGGRKQDVPDMNEIRTGAKPEEIQRVREHIARVAKQALLGQ